MSVASKKRRRAKRGGLLGHLARVVASLPPPPDPTTKAAAFARVALGRHGVVLVGSGVSAEHFERLRASFPHVERHPYVEPGAIVAVDLPPPPLDLGPLRFDP